MRLWERGRSSWKKVSWFLGGLMLILGANGLNAKAFAQSSMPSSSAVITTQSFYLQGQSDFIQISWNGTSGSLMQRDPTGTRESYSLTLLRVDAGPLGYAHYLAWFLARNERNFAILWCYLNNTGNDFYCWIYRYPSTQLSSIHFRGDYAVPPQVNLPSAKPLHLQLEQPPVYMGPDFIYRNWTKRGGSLPRLPLWPAAQATFAEPAAQTERQPVEVLTDLQAIPLHRVEVQPGNGWRADGWSELHVLAYDAQRNPYYLILYSNGTLGYAIDLRMGKIYVADFGAPVEFAPESSVFGADRNIFSPPPAPRIPSYTLQEITFYASGHYTNPYTQVRFDVDFNRPDGRVVTVPGFWDGGQIWRVRIAPTLIGDWEWRTRSNDPGLDSQKGRFTCIAEAKPTDGFFMVDPDNTREFRYQAGSHFLPVPVWLSLTSLLPSGPSEPSNSFKTLSSSISTAADPPKSLSPLDILQKLQSMGVNRLLGTWLLFPGSASLAKEDLDSVNPTFFQELDAMIKHCNALGIVPDIGLCAADSPLVKTMSHEQLARFWSYVVARYAAFNICWNLMDCSSDYSTIVQKRLQELVDITKKDDAQEHPITAILPGSHTPPTAFPDLSVLPEDEQQDGVIYIKSPAGLPLWPSPQRVNEQLLKMQQIVATQTPSTQVSNLDIISLNGGDLLEVTADLSYGKPIQVCDVVPSLEEARKRMWETRLAGGYWVAKEAPLLSGSELSPWVLQAVACGSLFKMVSYWLLRPHDELLLPVQQGGTVPPNVHVLANPGWYYVVYFPEGGEVKLDLLEATGKLQAIWFNPRTGTFSNTFQFTGGTQRVFQAPDTQDWVLLIRYPN